MLATNLADMGALLYKFIKKKRRRKNQTKPKINKTQFYLKNDFDNIPINIIILCGYIKYMHYY